MAKWPLPTAAAALPRVGGARLRRGRGRAPPQRGPDRESPGWALRTRSASVGPQPGGAGLGGGGTARAAAGSRWLPPPGLPRRLCSRARADARRGCGLDVGAYPGVLPLWPVLLGKAPKVLRQSAVAPLLRQPGCWGSDLLDEADSRSETEQKRQNPG